MNKECKEEEEEAGKNGKREFEEKSIGWLRVVNILAVSFFPV